MQGRLLRDARLLTVMLVSMVGILGTVVASPSLPGIATDLPVTEGQTGLVMSAYFLPSIVSIPVVGVLADVYGRRRFVLAGLALFGATGVAIAFVNDFETLIALRVLQGIGYSGLTPLAITVTGDLYTGAEGSTAQGIRESTHGLGQIVAPAIAGALADLAWNYPFLLYAIAFPVLAVAAVHLPETAPGEGGGFSPGEAMAELRAYSGALQVEAMDRAILGLMVGGFVIFFLKAAIITFVPLFAVRALGATATFVGLLLALRGAVRVVLAPLAGNVVDRLSRDLALGGVVGVAGLGVVLVMLSPSRWWLVGSFAVYSVGSSFMTPVLNDSVTSTASADRRAGIVSVFNITKSVGMVASPALLGVLLSVADFSAVFVVTAGLTFAYALGTVLLLGRGDGF